jgi:hypothetical protein
VLSTWGPEGRLALIRNAIATLAASFSVFLLSYTNGGFDTTTRAYAAIAAWWLIGAGAVLMLWSARTQISRFALAASILLALYTLWVLLSMSWAPDGERAFQQFNQVSLYVAVLVLAIAIARVVPVSWLVGGIALAVSGIAVVAFLSRVFPSTFPESTSQSSLLNALGVRLSFPLGNWNGLGIEIALAFPLLLAIMVTRRSRVASALAALPLPVIAVDMYLTSSRGAFVAGAVAIAAFLVLAVNRWTALAATVLLGISAGVAVDVVHSRQALVSGQMGTALGVHQGHVVAVVVLVVAVVTALVWVGAAELARRLPTPPSVVGWITAGAIVLAVVAGIVASHPLRRFEEFKTQSTITGSSNFVASHLLSTSGSGRWQLWTDAITQFKAHPLNGEGAGSYEFWWLQHRPIGLFSQFAHSLYLEALGELGIVGLLLIAAFVVVAIVGAVRARFLLRSSEIAGLAACGITFFASAAYDWVWQLSGIALVGVGALGLALGALPSTRPALWGRTSLARPLLALLAVAAIVPQVVVLAAGLHLQNSTTASDNGNLARAKSQALAAKAVEPWAATPYLDLAQIDYKVGRLGPARSLLAEAIARSHYNWELWWYAAQIDVRRGNITAAKNELDRARVLDPLDVNALLQAGTS